MFGNNGGLGVSMNINQDNMYEDEESASIQRKQSENYFG